jgi:glutamate racemase
MIDLSEKAKVFNSALNSIERGYNPDIILIACNTLSIVYPHTLYAKNSKTEVKGIVDSGVSLFENKLKSGTDKIIIFGTPTTINSNVYKNSLIKNGIDETQIVNQACSELETVIQNNPIGEEAKKSIAKFVSEASILANYDSQKVYAGFCCTHYGYSGQIFRDELSKQLNNEIEILNPNNTMSDFLFNDSDKVFASCKTTVEIVSQVKLKDNEIYSLAEIIRKKSPKAATALENYSFVKNLFAKV